MGAYEIHGEKVFHGEGWPLIDTVRDCFGAVLAACSGGVAENNGSTNVTVKEDAAATGPITEDLPPVSDVFFPKLQPSDELLPSARIRSDLVLDEEGCLRTDGGGGAPDYLPLWPSYFELSTEGDEIRVLDGEGAFVARIGGKIDTGGGEIQQGRTPRETFEVLRDLVGERTARQLRGRCPGPYWLVGPSEDHLQ